jgi:hypothetical protein
MESTMDNESAEVIHPKFKIWVRPDGIVQIRWAHAAVMNYEDAIAATDAMNKLTGGKRCPLLVDAQDAGPQDRAARSEFVRRGGDLVSAVALLGATPLSRMVGNFFIAVSRPMAPTKLFNDEPSALAWLREFMT